MVKGSVGLRGAFSPPDNRKSVGLSFPTKETTLERADF